MPLLDHFRPPLSASHPWMSVHSTWATSIAQQLNQELPEDYYAIPNVQLGGHFEIDVATLHATTANGTDGGVATAVWAPPQPTQVLQVDFEGLDIFEVQVFQTLGGSQLRAAIELVSPANKDRPSHRQAFAVKCASYLQQNVAVLIVDVVTERQANLQEDLARLLEVSIQNTSGARLHAVSYRPAATKLEFWAEPLAVGSDLPDIPLWIDAEQCLPVRLEDTYRDTCESLRIREAS